MSWNRRLEDGNGPNRTGFGKRMRSPSNKNRYNHHHHDFVSDIGSQQQQNQVNHDNHEQSPWQAMKRLRVAENLNDERNFPMLPQRAAEADCMAIDVPARTLFPRMNESSFKQQSEQQYTTADNDGWDQHGSRQPGIRYESINQLLGSLHNQRVHRVHPQPNTDGLISGNVNFENYDNGHSYSVERSAQNLNSSNDHRHQFEPQQRQTQYSIPAYHPIPYNQERNQASNLSNPVWRRNHIQLNGMEQKQQTKNERIVEQGQQQQEQHRSHNEAWLAQGVLHDRKRKVVRLFTNSKLG